jgi:hypothetical protein
MLAFLDRIDKVLAKNYPVFILEQADERFSALG